MTREHAYGCLTWALLAAFALFLAAWFSACAGCRIAPPPYTGPGATVEIIDP